MSLEDFCNQNNIIIKMKDHDMSVKGYCFPCCDSIIVILNSRHSVKTLRKTLKHELIHVLENHFNMDIVDYIACENKVDEIMMYVDDYLLQHDINTNV